MKKSIGFLWVIILLLFGVSCSGSLAPSKNYEETVKMFVNARNARDAETMIKLCPYENDTAIVEEHFSKMGSREEKSKYEILEVRDKSKEEAEAYNHENQLKGEVSEIKEVVIEGVTTSYYEGSTFQSTFEYTVYLVQIEKRWYVDWNKTILKGTSSENKVRDENANNILNTYGEKGEFHEGLAWLNYKNKTGTFWGCVDKTGKLLFQFSVEGQEELEEVKPFSNGYAYLSYENQLKVIDKNGSIVGEYKKGNVLAYGDGYIMVQERIADFDNSYYKVSILSSDGKEIESIHADDIRYCNAEYKGSGVFSFAGKLYSISAGKWLEDLDNYKIASTNDIYFHENIAIAGISYGGGYDSEDGYRGKLIFVDTSGKAEEVLIPKEMGWNWEYFPVVNNCCIINSHSYNDDRLISYNLETKEFHAMPEEYAEKVMYDERTESLGFQNGSIALPLKGSDGKKYIAVFDTKWNLLLGPMRSDGFSSISDNRIVISSITEDGKVEEIVYDEKGKPVFNVDEKGYGTIRTYSDGAANVGRVHPMYIDQWGNILFDIIDMSNFSN